jgi:UDP-N-acetylglucosamine 2-epimerase
MYDILLHATGIAEEKSRILDHLHIMPKGYDLLTLHRAETTDDPERLAEIINFVNEVAAQTPIIFPMHPRMAKAYAGTRGAFQENVRIIKPLGYFDLVKVLKNAHRLLTDSGGMQKEAYWLGIPCITLRDETEWLETVQSGWNILWRDYRGEHDPHEQPNAYGDGRAAIKMIDVLRERTICRHG